MRKITPFLIYLLMGLLYFFVVPVSAQISTVKISPEPPTSGQAKSPQKDSAQTLPGPLAAQPPFRYTETRYLRLGKDNRHDLLPGPIGFSGARFIDNRADTSYIAEDFVGSETLKFKIRDGFSAVSKYVNGHYAADFRKGRDSLFVMVNDFALSVSNWPPAGGEVSGSVKRHQLVRMKLVLAAKSESGVRILGNYDTLLAFKSFNPFQYASGVRQALKKILVGADALAENPLARRNNGRSQKTFTEKEFMATYKRGSMDDLAILKDKKLKKGVYLDFHQFLENSPQPGIIPALGAQTSPAQTSLTEAIARKNDFDQMPEYDEPVSWYQMNADGGTSVKVDSNRIWGYCDGELIFVNTKTPAGFYPVTRDGIIYEIPEQIKKEHRAKRKVTVMAVVGVVLVVAVFGTLIVLAAASSHAHGSGSGRGGGGSRGGSSGGAHHGSSPNVNFGSFSGGSSPGGIFIFPEIVLSDGRAEYRTRATRVDMETGELIF